MSLLIAMGLAVQFTIRRGLVFGIGGGAGTITFILGMTQIALTVLLPFIGLVLGLLNIRAMNGSKKLTLGLMAINIICLCGALAWLGNHLPER